VSEPREPLRSLLRQRRLDPGDPRVELALHLFRDAAATPEQLADEVAALLRREPRREGPADHRLPHHLLVVTRAVIAGTPELDADGAALALERAVRASGQGRRVVEHAVRLALTGRSQGPDLAGLVSVLGRDEVLRRLDQARGPVARKLA
jgi:glutamyl/glutaminyl-tRNA synthetase